MATSLIDPIVTPAEALIRHGQIPRMTVETTLMVASRQPEDFNRAVLDFLARHSK
jgi:hypothetical protein